MKGQEKYITIKYDPENKTIKVDPYVMDLSYKNGDTAEWICESEFDVNFGGKTPFVKTRFTHNGRNSGDVQRRPCGDDYFKYSVTAFGVTLDPGVIIKE